MQGRGDERMRSLLRCIGRVLDGRRDVDVHANACREPGEHVGEPRDPGGGKLRGGAPGDELAGRGDRIVPQHQLAVAAAARVELHPGHAVAGGRQEGLDGVLPVAVRLAGAKAAMAGDGRPLLEDQPSSSRLTGHLPATVGKVRVLNVAQRGGRADPVTGGRGGQMDERVARERLTAERAEVAQLLKSTQSDAEQDREVELDEFGNYADSAQPLTAQGLDDSIAEGLRDRLAAIDRALQRLDKGTYGRSVLSGDPIPDARLDADPAAELTVEEARARRGS